MAQADEPEKVIVGVDGSEASVEAVRQAQRFAVSLGARLVAWGCWEFPAGYEGYLAMGVDGFAREAEENLQHALRNAFGPDCQGTPYPGSFTGQRGQR